MKLDKLQAEIVEVLTKYPDVHLCVLGVAYTADDKSICTHGYTMIREKPKDHEEGLVRDNAAKKISLITAELMKDTYGV